MLVLTCRLRRLIGLYDDAMYGCSTQHDMLEDGGITPPLKIGRDYFLSEVRNEFGALQSDKIA